jgi:hypothetical protein
VSSLRPVVWSPADVAEWDLLLFEFVDAVLVHRERCAVCAQGGPWCQPLRECFESLLHWRRGRELRTLAARLRAEQDLADWRLAA